MNSLFSVFRPWVAVLAVALLEVASLTFLSGAAEAWCEGGALALLLLALVGMMR